MSLQYTPEHKTTEIHGVLTRTFSEGRTLPLEYRRHQLLQLARLVQENTDDIVESVKADLGRDTLETYILELSTIVSSSLQAAESLEEWSAPEVPQVEGSHSGWDPTIYQVPKGTVLLIAPWSFPWVLTMLPLFGAIAAGCTAMIKPPELAPHSAALMEELIPQYLDPDAYAVCLAAVEGTTHALNLKWDHIFFTGSTATGRIVAAAAAKHITPLTLALSGIPPVFVDGDTTDLEVAAKRILWGKILNAGQICAGANHVFVQEQHQSALVAALKKASEGFWPNGALDPSSGLGCMVNDLHYNRIKSLLQQTKGEVAFGGEGEGLRIAPAIVFDVTMDDPLMKDEIYGPILPIIPVANVDAAISHIRSGPTPVVIYLFTENEEIRNKFIQHTQSGQLILNDTVFQLAINEIPFGGQGHSGYGYHQGKYAFDTFTHKRGYINLPTDTTTERNVAARYRPYSARALEFCSQSLNAKIPDV